MASNYQGDMTQTQPPSALPSFAAAPIGSLPADGDALNASSVVQAYKACLDYLDFLRVKLAPFVGVRQYDSGYAYSIGDLVLYTTDNLHYRCTADVTGGTGPAADTAHWARFAIDLGTLSGQALSGFTVSTGDATIAGVYSFNFPATNYKMLVIQMVIGSDDTNIITLSGSAAFVNYALGATATAGADSPNYIDPGTIRTLVSGQTITLTLDAGGIGGSGGDLTLVVYGC